MRVERVNVGRMCVCVGVAPVTERQWCKGGRAVGDGCEIGDLNHIITSKSLDSFLRHILF